MRIAGLVKTSLIDYPGKIAAVVFTQGCNFSCGFCHNPDLIPIKGAELLSEKDLFDFLKNRRGKLDGVVITGGEPTIQPDLPQYIEKIKEMGFLVKLDTNGSNPVILQKLLVGKLVDYVAMDVKGPLASYQKICGFSDISKIKSSINLIMNSNVDYEFRTTALPFFHKISDVEDIGKMIKGARRYTIQGFRPEITLDKNLHSAEKFSQSDLEAIAKKLEGKVGEVVIHSNL